VGANATIVCGIELGRYAFVAAGAVVTKDVPDYALVMGVPASQVGWMSRHGHRLMNPNADGVMFCPESGYRYKEVSPNELRCLDLDEEQVLPQKLSVGFSSYDEFKASTANDWQTAREGGLPPMQQPVDCKQAPLARAGLVETN